MVMAKPFECWESNLGPARITSALNDSAISPSPSSSVSLKTQLLVNCQKLKWCSMCGKPSVWDYTLKGCLAKFDGQRLLPTFHRDSEQVNSPRPCRKSAQPLSKSQVSFNYRFAVDRAETLKGMCLFHSARTRSLTTAPALVALTSLESYMMYLWATFPLPWQNIVYRRKH